MAFGQMTIRPLQSVQLQKTPAEEYRGYTRDRQLLLARAYSLIQSCRFFWPSRDVRADE